MAIYGLNENDRDIFQQIASSRFRGTRPNGYKRRRSVASDEGQAGVAQIIAVKITTEIASCTQDDDTGKLTPATTIVRVLAKDGSGHYNASTGISTEELDVISLFKTITPAPGTGKWRLGYVNKSTNELIQRECEVFNEPSDTYS